MIILKELNPHGYATTPEIDKNLWMLLEKLNIVRAKYGKPMIVTSGLRSSEHQKKLVASGISKATKSAHEEGLAADIFDQDGSLKQFIMDNILLMKELGFYFEDFKYTKNWVHFSLRPPKSGKMFFIP